MTVACQAPLSIGFSRQEHWNELPCPHPRNIPYPGTEPMSSVAPALQVNSLTAEPPGQPRSPLRIRYFVIALNKCHILEGKHINSLNPFLWTRFRLDLLVQRSPNLLAPGTSFVEDNYSMGQGLGAWRLGTPRGRPPLRRERTEPRRAEIPTVDSHWQESRKCEACRGLCGDQLLEGGVQRGAESGQPWLLHVCVCVHACVYKTWDPKAFVCGSTGSFQLLDLPRNMCARSHFSRLKSL